MFAVIRIPTIIVAPLFNIVIFTINGIIIIIIIIIYLNHYRSCHQHYFRHSQQRHRHHHSRRYHHQQLSNHTVYMASLIAIEHAST